MPLYERRALLRLAGRTIYLSGWIALHSFRPILPSARQPYSTSVLLNYFRVVLNPDYFGHYFGVADSSFFGFPRCPILHNHSPAYTNYNVIPSAITTKPYFHSYIFHNSSFLKFRGLNRVQMFID